MLLLSAYSSVDLPIGLTPEEENALAYRLRERRRHAFQRSLQAKLVAPPEPARTTKENWKPLRRSC